MYPENQCHLLDCKKKIHNFEKETCIGARYDHGVLRAGDYWGGVAMYWGRMSVCCMRICQNVSLWGGSLHVEGPGGGLAGRSPCRGNAGVWGHIGVSGWHSEARGRVRRPVLLELTGSWHIGPIATWPRPSPPHPWPDAPAVPLSPHPPSPPISPNPITYYFPDSGTMAALRQAWQIQAWVIPKWPVPDLGHVRDTPSTPHPHPALGCSHSTLMASQASPPTSPGPVHRWGNQGTKRCESGGLGSPRGTRWPWRNSSSSLNSVFPSVKGERGWMPWPLI